jgi:tetratricopeptide (TPR) repeat protein
VIGPSIRSARALASALSIFVAMILAACGGGAVGAPTPPADLAGDALARGVAAHNAGKLDEATRAYYETLFRDPRNKFAFYDLGQIARLANKPAIAEGYYRSSLEIDPSYGPALFGLGAVRQTLGAIDDAIAIYRRDLAVEPTNAAAHFNLGILLRLVGKTAEGDAEIARGMQLDPKLTAPPSIRPTPTPTR